MLCNLKKFLRTYLFLIVGSAVFIIVSDPTKESKETAFASKSQKNKTNFADATSYRSGIPIEAAPAVKLIFENHRRKRVLSDSDVELKWMLSRIIPLLSIFAESYDE